MVQVITATFEDGVLKPHAPLDLPAKTAVRLIVETPGKLPQEVDQDWEDFCRLCDEMTFDSGGVRLTRDQLHERR